MPVSPALAVEPVGTTAPEPAKSPTRKRAIFGLVAIAALAGAGYEGQKWWTNGRFMVSTDDAYVDSDITLISSRVQGYVTKLAVSANDHVKAGDLLVQLDDGDYRNALQSAQSRVATSEQTLIRIEAQIDAARSAVTQAAASRDVTDAHLRNAKSNFSRISGLVEHNVAAQAQLDTATEGLDTATASLAQAQAAVASAKAQVAVLQAQYAEANGQKKELELAVAQAQRNLDMTTLRAPTDGVIANLALEQGNLVVPGTRLAALVADDGYFIEANYKETQIEGVEPGAIAHLSFDALPGVSFEGTVASVAPATGAVFSLLPPDNATGNFTKIVQRVPVRIEIPAEAIATGQLRAGLSVEVEVDRRSGAETHQQIALAE